MNLFFNGVGAGLIFLSSALPSLANDTATPVAASVGTAVRLDPTDGLKAVAGEHLQPQWSWTQRPGLSVADFSAADVLRPTFTPDIAGTYVATVSFFDADNPANTAPLHVVDIEVGTGNLTPVARIGGRGAPGGSSPILLDGAGSFDVDGDGLTYHWSVIDMPSGSDAGFADATAPMTGFMMDAEGLYRVGLSVQDDSGAVSSVVTYEISYLPDSGSTDSYRLSYDATRVATTGVQDLFDLGDRSVTGTHERVQGFELDSGAAINPDIATVTFGGIGHTLSTPQDFLALAAAIDADPDGTTNVRMSPNAAVNDLTFIFGTAGGSVTFEDVIGADLSRADLLAFGVDYYAGVGGRQVAPVASGRFDQLRATPGTALVLDAYGSSDLDGNALVPSAVMSASPSGAAPTVTLDADGQIAVTLDQPADHILTISVSDGDWIRSDQILVTGDPAANLRPVGRIAPVANPQAGTAFALDGTQSYDLDGDLLSHSWALLHRPAGSTASLGAFASGAETSFTPDLAGIYVLQLMVEDGSAAAVPVTIPVVVGAPLPRADAGADRLTDTSGIVALDGTASTGGPLSYSWSALGLTGSGSVGQFNDSHAAQPALALDVTSARFTDIISTSPVYHIKRSDLGGLCNFDTRLPGDLPGTSAAEPVSISLMSRGQQSVASGDIIVWEIENKNDHTRSVDLKLADGTPLGSVTVPGRVSVHVTTPDFGKGDLYAWVGSASVATARVKNNPFNRNNPVCVVAGSGVVQLIVTDGNGWSLPDTAFIGDANLRPVLRRSARLTGERGVAVPLNGAALAFDGNGDALSFGWSLIHRPASSQAALSGGPLVTAPNLDFTPDRAGLYLIQLTASDGATQAVPVVIVIEVPNTAPIAAATVDADHFVGEVATLDGTGSFDPDGDALTYVWTIVSAPQGSTAQIANANAPIASFTPDIRGDYVFALTVSDYDLSSAPVTVAMTAPNRAPVADLVGPDSIVVNEVTEFSAAASSDPDGDALSFTYSFTAAPAGSAPAINDLGGGLVEVATDRSGAYTLQVTVDDGLAQSTASLDISATVPNLPPVLGNVNSLYTVELGLELALDLSAVDPDGDPVSFFANPLPLASGITLDATSGMIRFRPEQGQIGSHAFTIGASDGSLTDTAVLNIEVVPANAGETAVFGFVFDAVDRANGTDTPLVGIPVRLENAALATITDSAGRFSFGSLTAGSDRVLVEPSATGGPGGYVGEIRAITITDNQNRDLAPDFLLAPLNDGCAQVVAGQNTVLTGNTSGVTVIIPADSVTDAAGAAYSGNVCLGTLPQLFAHEALPRDVQACHIYALDAPGALFTAGATLTAPNADNLPEGTSLNLWQLNTSGAAFRRAANAGVDTGAATVTSAAGAFDNGMLFSFLPKAPSAIASDDTPTGNRSLSLFEGDLAQSYTLPGYTAFNRTQQVSLAYHSAAADPTVIVAGDVTISSDASLPATLDSRIEVGGLSLANTASWTPRQAADGTTPALVGEAVTLRQSTPVDATGLPSGRYDYRFTTRAQYDCSTVAAGHKGEFYVQNQTQSPLGTGWSVAGLQKLTQNPDGSVAIMDDSSVTPFDPRPTFTEFEDEPLVFHINGGQDAKIQDIDDDGLPDILYADTGPGDVGILRNLGDKEIVQEPGIHVVNPTSVPQTGTYTPNLTGIGVGRFGTDEGLDVVTTAQFQRGYSFARAVDFGGTAASVTFKRLPTVLGSLQPLDVAVADFDKDGYLDFALGLIRNEFLRQDALGVYWGNADGFSHPSPYRTGFSGWGVLQLELGDIDQDGNQDIAYRDRDGISFRFNQGGRSFTTVKLGLGPRSPRLMGKYFQLADLNNDGFLDVITAMGSTLNVYTNIDGRSFSSAVIYQKPPASSSLTAIKAHDVNQDGKPDILLSTGYEGDTVSGTLAIYYGNDDGTLQPYELGQLDEAFSDFQIADLNEDGGLDLIILRRFEIKIYFSKPSDTGAYISGKGDFSTLEKLADGTWTRTYKDGSVVEFDANGLQTSIVDPQGNRKTYTYDGSGRLVTITDEAGGITTFAYDATGRVLSITYPDGRATQFAYEEGYLGEVTEPTGTKVSFSYDIDGRLVSSLNQNGNNTSYSYDAIGRLSGATFPDGSSVRNQVGATLGLVDGLGGPATSPLVYVAPEDRITTVTDRKGQVTEIEVNQFGSVIRTTDPLGRITLIERDDNNLALQVERPSTTGGTRVDTIEYDEAGNVTELTEAVGTAAERTTAYIYEPIFNKVTSMTDPGGFVTAYEYDATGLPTKISDPEGGAQVMTYTPEGHLVSRTDENGNATRYAYNASGNLDTVTYVDGSVTQTTYDASGNATVIAEAQGTGVERQVHRTYDPLRRVLSIE
ncbi:MAG: FG-GAP-like repeat-containing protein, partial [Albidovulum sp.]|uniref:PKD domain-containing protein n=1 Tax=Albidovulum sp. TaxID=1872424 RepID=UPI003C812C2C